MPNSLAILLYLEKTLYEAPDDLCTPINVHLLTPLNEPS